MFELTEEQRREPGEPEPMTVDPHTREAHVLLRKEEYHRLKGLDYDDSPWTEEEMDLLAAEDAERLGWEGMEAYQALPW